MVVGGHDLLMDSGGVVPASAVGSMIPSATKNGILPRAVRLAALERIFFDVLVVGGGITGAASARDAASRRLSVALIEKDDWASGTSWRSSKLVHGGLRYLRQGAVGLVFESLSERARLLRTAPHLVRPLEFLFAIPPGGWVSPLALSAGLTLYDALALGRGPRHRRLSASETVLAEPLLAGMAIAGGALYTDARVDDARLTLENVLDAMELGCLAVSRVALDRRIAGERFLASDRESGRTFEVRARTAIYAGGPWTDDPPLVAERSASAPLRLSKGVHVTVAAARLPLRRAVAVPVERGRLLFAIPSGPVTLIGTTETPYTGAPDGVNAGADDVAYLLARTADFFPAARLGPADLLAAFAGLRVLRAAPGRDVSTASREESLESRDGVVRVTGGKLTTHRRIGSRAVDAAAVFLRQEGRSLSPSGTAGRPFPGSPPVAFADFVDRFVGEAGRAGVAEPLARHFADRYGVRAEGLLGVLRDRPDLVRPLDPDLPDVDAEIVFAARSEDARSVSDALIRRTHVFWQARGQGLAAARRVARLLGGELGWTAEQEDRSVEQYSAAVAASSAALTSE